MDTASLRKSLLLTLAGALCAASLGGCAGLLPKPQSTVSLASLAVTPPTLLVARKSPRVLYLVLDPAKVPGEKGILVSGRDNGGKVTELQLFVARDLKSAFSNYFADVRVIGPGELAALGEKGFVLADVRIDRLEVIITSVASSGAMVVRGGGVAMTWSIGLRAAEGADYLYSFAGQSTGQSGTEADFIFRSMFEGAIVDVLKGYTDKKVHQQVLELPAPAPVRAPPVSRSLGSAPGPEARAL